MIRLNLMVSFTRLLKTQLTVITEHGEIKLECLTLLLVSPYLRPGSLVERVNVGSLQEISICQYVRI